MEKDILLAFCVVYRCHLQVLFTDGQIMPGVFQHSYCSGIINFFSDGFTYNTGGHFAHCSYFSSPNTLTCQIYVHIIIMENYCTIYNIYYTYMYQVGWGTFHCQ